VESRPAVEQDLRRRDLLVGLELSQLALPGPHVTQPVEQVFPSSSRKAHALELFAKLPREYDEMGRLLSFGEDRRWRKAMVRAIEASPTDRVLDVATGTGLVAAELVRRYRCSVVGIDQSDEMLARARRRLVR
jgi:ubiquinone/menaquinone biosynthesis C-methylase UbiE